jgi:hypothetical protein
LIQSTSAAVPVWVQEVINSYILDEFVQGLFLELAIVSPNDKGYSVSQGLIRFKKKIWVGSNSAIQTKILDAFHSSALGGGGAFWDAGYIQEG